MLSRAGGSELHGIPTSAFMTFPINRIVGSVDRAAAPHARQLQLGWRRKREHLRNGGRPLPRVHD